jgi:uncharacterized protein (TIGR00725 family)
MQPKNKIGKTIIGVMGGGSVKDATQKMAFQLGGLIAREGWILLNGGRNAGVMAASAAGAKAHGGLTVGILPDGQDDGLCPDIDICIRTEMGNARNCINVLSSDVVVACPGGAGTISEIALALKSGKPVILISFDIGLCFAEQMKRGQLMEVDTPELAVDVIKRILKGT